ncbi:MAG: hypothetical protein A3H92_11715 [Rhodospirillales bacterium RIFCSPLOWO2_02_FULL_58_16]|nr:MAG: hypothetical protein A3H92_11715 [Rhodospirillales bacterium RIFCSPLOWO2_02_FULL_58_16]
MKGAQSPDDDSLLCSAADDFRGGNIADAQEKLRRYLESFPGHAQALHLLGLTLHRSGQFDEAADFIERAIAVDGQNPGFHSNHGVVLNLLGRAVEGEAACRRAVALAPDHAEAHNNLGVSLKLQGRLCEAADACRRAAEILPGYADAYINLGNIHLQEGRAGEAVLSFQKAAALAPGNAMAHSNLGAALREQGDADQALEHCRCAVDLNPDYAEAHNNLGNVLKGRGDLEGAEKVFRRAVALKPGYADAQVNLGGVLFVQGRFAEAEDAYRRAVLDNPNHAEAHNGLGVVLLAVARLNEALACFNRAVELDPGHAEALYALASSRSGSLDETKVKGIEARLAAGEKLATAERIALHFSLGEIYDEKGEFPEAFAHFQAGNDLRKIELERRGHVFDAKAHDRLVERIINTYSPALFAERQGCGVRSTLPVFIVGMPRSGTTLVEQIAAGHPLVHGAGELNEIALLADGSTGAAEAYIARLQGLAGEAARVIDKTPFNFLYLGVIALLFPQARIIHCRREARDLRLSCYFQNFVSPFPWSADLKDLGRYFNAYRRLMDHWSNVLPLPVLDVDYENVVSDLEGQSRRIIDFLGLPWDESCLAFHKNTRVVATAGSWQVRRPLYATSVGRWRNYEQFLGPPV